MEWSKKNWIGNWENFENYIQSEEEHMVKAWSLVQDATKDMPMFQNGAKAFWQMACTTVNEENKDFIDGWKVTDTTDGLFITWYGNHQTILFEGDYTLFKILGKGLEGKPNYIFKAEKSSPFQYLLAMEPMPNKKAKENGGLIRHLHYQFASTLESLIQNEKLVKPYWYATMCDKDCTVLDKCNIILAMHHLPKWNTLS